MVKTIKPLLKWVGGKTQLLSEILKRTPRIIENYHEPFLGGGSVLLGILSSENIVIRGKIYASDANCVLIGFYKNVQNKKDELFNAVKNYINEYDKCVGDVINRKAMTLAEAKGSKESYYYWLRKEFNEMEDKLSVNGSALFLVLNKLCFRGMYRTGPKGFNVPYGHYKKTPQVINKEHLDKVSNLISNVEFSCEDFQLALKKCQMDDYVYLDPPYYPISSTSFISYGLKDKMNIKTLLHCTYCLSKMKILYQMSNSDVKVLREYYNKEQVDGVNVRRSINSKNPSSRCGELLIMNYEL